MTTAQELADQRHRDHMRTLLAQAAEQFGFDLAREPVFGWRDRTIGAPAHSPHGDLWVRVTTEFPAWAYGRVWTGNTDATALTGVPRPEVAEQVYRVFGDQLATPDGVRAQLFVIARLLLRIERGDDPAVAPLLHQRARELLGR
ncbi:hypothetical protein ACIRPH_29535 [Nocardiopsis sp. NPDC101807]|uniref:hypothetical protein n=1 Tax=Nocardiopsis sp. NPDC101807 TaxID=3364339 RepID=UPI0037F1A3C9